MGHSKIQIAVQKAGETIYVSESKADAQVYMNLSRASLERMLEEGCEIQGFTADIYETSASASDKVFMTYRGRLKDWEIMSREEREETLERMEFLNADGEAVGYLVGDYLVGKVIDSCDEYINLEWWMPVGAYEATEEPVTTYSNGKWYNPTNQERADREIKEELNGGRQ